MSGDVRPALTSEEWDARRWVRTTGQPMEEELWGGANVGALNISQDGDLLAQLWPKDRHALAALALHGQPFGFTREHADAVARLLFALEDLSDWFGCTLPEDRERTERLAGEVVERIAALLPPREETG